MSTEDLRESILNLVGYTDIELPHGKTMRAHAYISGRAMDVYIANSEDSKAAFEHMVAASVEGQSVDVPSLTEEDADIIARLYADSGGFLDEYVESRKNADVFQAFYSAFSATESWHQWKRGQAKLEAELESHSKLVSGGFAVESQGIGKILSETQRLIAECFSTTDLSAWLGTRSIATQFANPSYMLKLAAAEQLSTVSQINLDSWTRLSKQLDLDGEFGHRFNLHSSHLVIINQRTAVASQILRSHADVFSKFSELAEALRLKTPAIHELLELARRAFDGSDKLVLEASQFFSREPVRPIPIREAVHLVDLETRRVFDVGEHIEEAAEQSQELVHAGAEQAILVGNDILVMLREVVSSTVGEVLEPLSPIVERMKLLANPKNFMEILQAFAILFQREHWKDLWVDQGKTYKPKPEGLARMALSMFLQGCFGGAAFVGKELANGDGYIDLVVNYLGLDYVVEVKIIGATWGIGDAKSGLNQLDAYLQNYDTSTGYLLVFDGRKSMKGEQLQSEYKLKSGATAQVVVVKSYFDKPSA